jgi:undecaprenyl-diphosphatase
MPDLSFLDRILHFISLYGYYIVFFAVMLENAAFLGLLVPGETILLAAGFYASRGSFNIYYVILIAFVGAVVGDNLAYWVGRKSGRPFLDRHHKFFRMSRARMGKAEKFYARHGAKTVLIGRWTTYLRVLMAPLAGIYKMSYPKFLIYDLIGGLAWATANSLLGYYFGRNWDLLMKIIDVMGWTTLVVAVLVAVGIYGFYRVKRIQKARDTREANGP